MKSFEETIESLKKLADSTSIRQILCRPEISEVMETVKMLEEDIKKAIEEKPINNLPEEMAWVCDNIKTLIKALAIEVYGDEFKEFCNDYLLLVSNWNTLFDNSEVLQTCKALRNILSFGDCIVESIEISRILNRELKKFLEFKPHSFNLSKHYLLSLHEEIEGRGKCEK